MKYLVLLCDGMADTPVPELGGKTPMEAAQKPNMDALAREALVGTAKTVPDGMKPGSDVANLSALGYHPADCYTGRSPGRPPASALTWPRTSTPSAATWSPSATSPPTRTSPWWTTASGTSPRRRPRS